MVYRDKMREKKNMMEYAKWAFLGFALMTSVLVITCALLKGGNGDDD